MRHLKTFTATTSDGQAHEISLYVDEVVLADFDGAADRTPVHELRDGEGAAVSRISKGRYRLLSGLTVTSDSPDAP